MFCILLFSLANVSIRPWQSVFGRSLFQYAYWLSTMKNNVQISTILCYTLFLFLYIIINSYINFNLIFFLKRNIMLSERVKYSRYNKNSSEHIKHLQLPGQCIVLLFTQNINVLFHFLSRWGGGVSQLIRTRYNLCQKGYDRVWIVHRVWFLKRKFLNYSTLVLAFFYVLKLKLCQLLPSHNIDLIGHVQV